MAKANPNKDFFAQAKKLAGDFEEGRGGRKGYEAIEVEDGAYIVRFHALDFSVIEMQKKQVPKVRLTSIVVDAADQDDLGKKVTKDYLLSAYKGKTTEGKEFEITVAEVFADLCSALQSFGIDTSELELEDLEAVNDDLSSDNPACKVKIGTSKKGTKYVNWGKLVDDDEDLPSLDDVMDEDEDSEPAPKKSSKPAKGKAKAAPEPEDDEDDDDDDDDDAEPDDDDDASDDEEDFFDEEDEDDDDDDYKPAKGDTVQAQPPKTKVPAEYKVTSVNVKQETCTLVRSRDSKEFKAVPWDAITG